MEKKKKKRRGHRKKEDEEDPTDQQFSSFFLLMKIRCHLDTLQSTIRLLSSSFNIVSFERVSMA